MPSPKHTRLLILQEFRNRHLSIAPDGLAALLKMFSGWNGSDGEMREELRGLCDALDHTAISLGERITAKFVEDAQRKLSNSSSMALKDGVMVPPEGTGVDYVEEIGQFAIIHPPTHSTPTGAADKIAFSLSRMRVLRHLIAGPLASEAARAFGGARVRTIRSMHGGVADAAVTVFGMLTRASLDDAWLLEGIGGAHLRVAGPRGDFERLPEQVGNGFLFEGAAAIVHGAFDAGTLCATHVGLPPLLSPAAEAREVRANFRVSAGEREECLPRLFPDTALRLQKGFLDHAPAALVVLADVHLNDARAVAALRKLLAGYSATGFPVAALVLIGPFVSPRVEAALSAQAAPFERERAAFETLGQVFGEYRDFLGATHVFIVPAPGDPILSGDVLPRGPLPAALRAPVLRAVPGTHFVTSPSRFNVFGHTVVLHHAMELEELCVRAPFPTRRGAAPERRVTAFEHLAATLLSQRSVHPLLPEARAVRWDAAAAFSLFPAPDLLVLAGLGAPMAVEGATWALCPGSFSAEGDFFVFYFDAERHRCEASSVSLG
eukprot:gnl/Chilomastix_cuspidata/1657.p1 GENE.gnl/Chilomastix_cuspidata/1657~~gnl/Chilomastix_cuspidata/1657.p1  ORF type:complete len:549 (-),score=268.90 gnl/Chilomastix_cuspidata/1657:1297-2943(-)